MAQEGGPDARLLQELLLHSNTDCAQFCPVQWGAAAGGDGSGGAGGSDDDEAGTASPADWLAVATYELDESTRTRTGSLMLYTLLEEEEEEYEQPERRPRRRRRRRLALSARRDALPGVFDAQWLRLPAGGWGVSLALSDGRVVVLAVGEQETDAAGDGDEEAGAPAGPRLSLKTVAEWQAIRGPAGLQDDATKRMALMIAWERPEAQRAAVSGSGGTVAVMEEGGGAGAAMMSGGRGGDGNSSGSPWSEWRAHDLEAWAVAFDPWRPPTLYSGSDDASLKLWDLRMARRSSSGSRSDGGGGDDGGATTAPAPPALLLCDKRTHAAGVTCISPHPSREYILATGSYDEKARLWDARRPRSPLAEIDVGGGAWRLQWRPAVDGGGGRKAEGDLILAACMYNGFAVLRATGFDGEEETGLEVAERLGAPHESIAYGCDWWRGRRRGRERAAGSDGDASAAVVATASFYDRRLCLWEPQTPSIS